MGKDELRVQEISKWKEDPSRAVCILHDGKRQRPCETMTAQGEQWNGSQGSLVGKNRDGKDRNKAEWRV